ncbi:MAG: hypothetical protein Q9221_009165 [Calogaya cf. arnoldii]
MAEFSDRPMTPSPEQYYGFFPGKYTTAYLESYVDNHTYSGQTIRDRISFNTYVESITKILCPETADGAQWEIIYNKNRKIRTSKLIDATGMTSQPHIPIIPGSSDFKGITLHHKSFGESQDLLLKDPLIQNICIIGGAKSAADVAYACAKAPFQRKIHWIIREDGNGPSAFFAAPAMTSQYANSNEGFYNRFLASFLPNRFGNKWGWLKWLLQRTYIGRWYTKRLWAGFDKGLREFHDYQREEGRATGFANLEYDTPIFWQNDSSGVCNHPDFLSTIAKNVHIHRNNISHLSTNSITLRPSRNFTEDSKPLTLPIDILIYCTGWSPHTTLFPPETAQQLGHSVPLSHANPQLQSHWSALEDAADPTILAELPTLAHPPAYRQIPSSSTPFRLYKAIAPPSDPTHSLVFLGKIVVGNNFRVAEAQALWAVAYLDGNIGDLPEREEMKREVAETVAWDRRRYLNKGELGSWFYYDVVDYSDALLEQVGLRSHRKGWKRDLVEPCFAGDLRELGREYKGLCRV